MEAIELSVGKQGRIVIPASLRKQMAIQVGTQLLARVENGCLIMESKQNFWRSIREECECQATPNSASLAQSLMAERKLEAEKENV